MLIAFFVSVLNQVSEYYSAGIFNAHFASKNELSAFLSLYTVGSDFLTLVLQLFFVSKLLNATGVRKANYIYPTSYISLLAIFIFFPGLAIGVMMRFLRKNVSAIIRTPVHNIIMAASPGDRMAGVKSFIGGIVNSSGMIAGGFCILLISKKMSVREGYIFTLSIAVIYLIFTHFQNRSYIKTISNRIKFDSHIREDDEDIYTLNDYTGILINDNSKKNLVLIETMFNSRPSLELVSLINSNYEKFGKEAREKMLNLLRTGKSEHEFEILSKAVSDSDWEIRAAALSILSERNLSFRKKVLQNMYPKMLGGEKHAVAIITGLSEDGQDINTDDFVLEKLVNIKDGVMSGKLPAAEFIMLIQVLPYQYFLNFLYELVIFKKDVNLFKCLTPFADKLSRRAYY